MADTWTDRLSDYLDGELPPVERGALEAHLAGCRECSATLDDLRRVAARAASLAPRAPSADLWPAIESHIAARRTGDVRSVGTRSSRRISFTMPQLVAASLALMVLSGGAVWIGQHGGRATSLPSLSATNESGARRASDRAVAVSLPDPYYDEAVADLEQTFESHRSTLDPQTVKVVQDNLAAIDRAIDESRGALEQDPANIYLNNHLADARQQKLMLLRRATALASTKG